jgi:hypothetical protein
MGFDDHKQEVFNLVQALRVLFLYTESEKEMVEEYGRNLKSLWDTVEAFGGTPGPHRGMMEALARDPKKVADLNNLMPDEITKLENEANKAVKVALLISGADKRRFSKLKDNLANNYLLGTDQYPNTFEKALRILGNYQSTKSGVPYCASPNNTSVAFLQRGGEQGGRAGRGAQTKGPAKKDGSSGEDASNKVSTMTGWSSKGPRSNSKGESHCFHCGAADHWAYKCPELSREQQDQLHMTLQGEGKWGNAGQEEGRQLLNVALVQRGTLPDNQAYLNGCSTVTAFKSGKYLKGVKTLAWGIRINCNAGAVTTNRKGT